MHNSSLDLNLGQHSNNNNFNININNNSNLSTSTSDSNDNECIFNCSNTKVLLISNNNNNNNNNTKTGIQMMAAQEKKTADDESVEKVASANITNTNGGGVIVGVVKTHNRDDIMYNAEEESKQKAGGLHVTSGILVDESASYETDEETERMQLNPSDDEGWDDEYDADDDDDDDGDGEDADEDETDDEDDTYEHENEDANAPYIGNAATVNVAAQEHVSATFEVLPEAKGLVQALVDDENESVKNMPDTLKTKSISAGSSASKVEDEEEDMGFDEDDERIAIIVERQRSNANEHDKDFMNEEGSGAGGGAYRRTEANRYKNNNRFRLDYTEKYRRKQQKLQTEYTNRGVADAREGSGNFANDNDDDDDDDSDDDDVDDDDDDGDDGVDDADVANSNADANDDADRQEGDGYFNSKHTKSSNRYFRKNTNDAIKIISTPLGKVGIVYQQTPTNEDGNNNNNNANNNNKKQDTLGDKKTSSFTDFDALSPDPESSHRLASSHPKITPVLTPDGKVALLYRGDSENSKYEPIRNLTHKFNNNNNNNNNNKNDFTDNKAIASGTSNKDTPDFPNNDGSEDESADESEDDYDLDNDSSSSSGGNDRTQLHARKNNANPTDETQKAAIQNPATDADAPAAAGGSFIIRPTDSVLPMINRPLSEVLGIKKNQFKQFRIKDIPTAPPNSETAGDPRSLAGTSIDRTLDTTTLHFLTKVNLAEYPTSMKTRNYDFDFSRDNTMLDERTRHKEHQFHQQQGGSGATAGGTAGESGNSNNKLNTIANEEVLAKTEVVNLAIIPHFDEELERLQRMREHETRRHYRQRYRQKPSEEELSGIHCIMQAMMGIAAISTVFGMLGTFFKQRILDQIRLMHW